MNTVNQFSFSSALMTVNFYNLKFARLSTILKFPYISCKSNAFKKDLDYKAKDEPVVLYDKECVS